MLREAKPLTYLMASGHSCIASRLKMRCALSRTVGDMSSTDVPAGRVDPGLPRSSSQAQSVLTALSTDPCVLTPSSTTPHASGKRSKMHSPRWMLVTRRSPPHLQTQHNTMALGHRPGVKVGLRRRVLTNGRINT